MDTIDLPEVRGFRFGAVAAGIKKRGGLDVGAIVADTDVPVSALFTKNLVKAAPVRIASERTAKGRARAVLVNAGCANACTGAAGLDATRSTTALLAAKLGVPAVRVIPASTGVIGVLLPTEPFARCIEALCESLAADGAEAFARAICTTDRWPKVASARESVGGEHVTVVGIAKGAGMIHPDMATTLAFVVTDANVTSRVLDRVLREAASGTFNALSVDGDTSTNDTLLAMASGAADPHRPITRPGDVQKLTALFVRVLEDLARSIAADGEGASHQVTVRVTGVATDAGARKIVQAIATSPLVKTALFGQDPNWGRILAAAGRAGVKFDPARASIRVGDVEIVRGGLAAGGDAESRAHEVMRTASYEIHVKLGSGRGHAHCHTCDLGHGYVDVNASYRS